MTRDILSILNAREKSLAGVSYKLQENQFALDTAFTVEPAVDERNMAVTFPFADGNRRDGVGDLLDVTGINTERHRKNPIILFDHGKQVVLPIGKSEDPDSGQYTVFIDPISKVASVKAFFYQGEKMAGSNDHAVFCEQLFDLMAKKFVRGGSIGYQVIDGRELYPDYATGTPKGLHLVKTLLLEASAVVTPANMDTVRKGLSPDPHEILCKGVSCGKPLSPHLVKSLGASAPPRNETVVSGFAAKAGPLGRVGDRVSVVVNNGGRNLGTGEVTHSPIEPGSPWMRIRVDTPHPDTQDIIPAGTNVDALPQELRNPPPPPEPEDEGGSDDLKSLRMRVRKKAGPLGVPGDEVVMETGDGPIRGRVTRPPQNRSGVVGVTPHPGQGEWDPETQYGFHGRELRNPPPPPEPEDEGGSDDLKSLRMRVRKKANDPLDRSHLSVYDNDDPVSSAEDARKEVDKFEGYRNQRTFVDPNVPLTPTQWEDRNAQRDADMNPPGGFKSIRMKVRGKANGAPTPDEVKAHFEGQGVPVLMSTQSGQTLKVMVPHEHVERANQLATERGWHQGHVTVSGGDKSLKGMESRRKAGPIRPGDEVEVPAISGSDIPAGRGRFLRTQQSRIIPGVRNAIVEREIDGQRMEVGHRIDSMRSPSPPVDEDFEEGDLKSLRMRVRGKANRKISTSVFEWTDGGGNKRRMYLTEAENEQGSGTYPFSSLDRAGQERTIRDETNRLRSQGHDVDLDDQAAGKGMRMKTWGKSDGAFDPRIAVNMARDGDWEVLGDYHEDTLGAHPKYRAGQEILVRQRTGEWERARMITPGGQSHHVWYPTSGENHHARDAEVMHAPETKSQPGVTEGSRVRLNTSSRRTPTHTVREVGVPMTNAELAQGQPPTHSGTHVVIRPHSRHGREELVRIDEVTETGPPPGKSFRKSLDVLGGVVPSDLEVAKHADFITLPEGVQGTNCSNCAYREEREDKNFCVHPDLKGQEINERNCCAYWSNPDMIRAWEGSGEKRLKSLRSRVRGKALRRSRPPLLVDDDDGTKAMKGYGPDDRKLSDHIFREDEGANVPLVPPGRQAEYNRYVDRLGEGAIDLDVEPPTPGHHNDTITPEKGLKSVRMRVRKKAGTSLMRISDMKPGMVFAFGDRQYMVREPGITPHPNHPGMLRVPLTNLSSRHDFNSTHREYDEYEVIHDPNTWRQEQSSEASSGVTYTRPRA